MQIARDKPTRLQQKAYWEAETQKGNDDKVNFASQRRVQKAPEHRSDTDDPWSYPKVTLEVELSLWSQDQSQRTVQQANVNLVGNAEFRSHGMMVIMFVKRQSEATPKTTMNSRTTHFWQVQWARRKSSLSLQVTKDLEKFLVEMSGCTSNDAFRRRRI